MSERINLPQVGAPDPEQRNSPIIAESGNGVEKSGMAMGESAVCYFNGVAFHHHVYVCSGDELLRCERGNWLRMGSCDRDNP